MELYNGYSARTLLVEDDRVVGVGLGEVGLSSHGGGKSNHRPAEEIRARVTILADGTRGVLSQQLRERFGAGRNPQVYSLGIKAVVAFPGENPFGANRVMHTLGYPNPASVFGGGFLYSMGEKLVAVGLILGLDWKYGDLNPQREFERYRAHPFIAGLLKGSVTIATGARTIPEGGYHALGKIAVPGALVVGDGAGFVNMEKIKGIHYGILSGMAAAETVAEGLAADGDAGPALRLRRAAGGARRAAGHAPRPQLPPELPLGHLRGRAAVAGPVEDPAAPRHGAGLQGDEEARAPGPRGPGRHGRGDVRQPHRLPPPRGRAGPHDDPGPGGVRGLRGGLRQLLHGVLPGPGLPVGRFEDRAQRVELPPLHDLRGEVPAGEHQLAAARGRRGSPLQADVGASRPVCRRKALMARDPRYDILFEPVKIGPVTARNRFYQVPHCTGMGWQRPRTVAAMRGVKAEGGWGVVCTEYTSIHPASDDLHYVSASLWDDSDVRAHALMTDLVHEHGALAGAELWFGGVRSANLSTRLTSMDVAGYPNAVGHPFQTRAMDKRDIRDLRRWHRNAALRAREAGFDIVYVYATHGYLVSNFLDPARQHAQRRVRRVAGEPDAAGSRADRGHQGGRRRSLCGGRALLGR